MGGNRIEFAQFGHFDSFAIIRSVTSMVGVADADLPEPIATGLKTMYYVDADVIAYQTYYYKVRVWRGAASFVSDELLVYTHTEKLLMFLPLTESLVDKGALRTIWLNEGGVTFGPDGAFFNAYPHSLYQASHAINFNNDYKISFEVKRIASNNTYPNIFDNDKTSLWSAGSLGCTFAGENADSSLRNRIMAGVSGHYAQGVDMLMSNNVFYKVEVAKTNGVVTIKVDDVIVLSRNDAPTIVAAFLRLGRAANNGADGQFKGYIRNFKVYDMS